MDLVDIGKYSFIVRREDKAVKIPKYRDDNGDDEFLAECSRGHIQQECQVARAIAGVEGVVPYFSLSDTEIEMPLMRLGNLASYMQDHPDTPLSMRLSWIRAIATTINNIHARRVLVSDIALRNFLVDDDLSLKLCDFDNSEVIPDNEDMNASRPSTACLQLDIAQFGAVVYELITGNKGPSVETMEEDGEEYPNTRGVMLGDMISRCWVEEGGFQNMAHICRALDADLKRLERRLIAENVIVILPLALGVALSMLSHFRRK